MLSTMDPHNMAAEEPSEGEPAALRELHRIRLQARLALAVALVGLIAGPALGAVVATSLVKAGPAGAAGAAGPAGVPGPTGPVGPIGARGLPGSNGASVDIGSIQQQVLTLGPILVRQMCIRTNAVTDVYFIADNGVGVPVAGTRKFTVCGLP